MKRGSDNLIYPCFDDYAINKVTFDFPTAAGVAEKTCLCGIYSVDARLANATCGYEGTPIGYVWHYVEDMKTMLLVPQDIHSTAFGGIPHTGGASMIRNLLEGV